jgi:hypothetical protein
MSRYLKSFVVALLALPMLAIYGCGGGGGSSTPLVDTSSVQKGAVIQGPVVGATVFADNVSAGTRFVLDAAEIVSSPTVAGGAFNLPTFPGYDFVLVSIGGIDTITNQPALLMLAPAGSANITPLTTLVALDTSKTIQAKLESLMGGAKFDSNVSTSSSPAMLMLIKSAETAVQSVSDAVKQAGVDAGKAIDQKQLNYIQAQTWQQIALEFARSSQNLSTPAGLYSALNTSIINAIAAIRAEPANSNISSFATISSLAIANASVNAALNAMGAGVDRTSTTALSTTSIKAESSLLNPTTVFAAAVTSTVNALKTISSVIVIGVTPNPFSPAPIPVVTVTNAAIIRILTGASGGFGGTGVTF